MDKSLQQKLIAVLAVIAVVAAVFFLVRQFAAPGETIAAPGEKGSATGPGGTNTPGAQAKMQMAGKADTGDR